MEALNTAPILEQIREDARQSAAKLIEEARNRADAIADFAASRVSREEESILAQAAQEADKLEDRMLRLDQLEERKELVAMKRAKIDRVFDRALAQLNALPAGQVEHTMAALLVQNAQGTESLQAGQVNDAFFTPAFIQAVNQQLEKQGKPGKLTMLEQRIPGVCGLVIKGAHSETHCTFKALLDLRRDALEAGVAEKLFPVTED